MDSDKMSGSSTNSYRAALKVQDFEYINLLSAVKKTIFFSSCPICPTDNINRKPAVSFERKNNVHFNRQIDETKKQLNLWYITCPST